MPCIDLPVWQVPTRTIARYTAEIYCTSSLTFTPAFRRLSPGSFRSLKQMNAGWQGVYTVPTQRMMQSQKSGGVVAEPSKTQRNQRKWPLNWSPKMFSPILSSFSPGELIGLLVFIGFFLIFKYLFELLVNDVHYHKVGGTSLMQGTVGHADQWESLRRLKESWWFNELDSAKVIPKS